MKRHASGVDPVAVSLGDAALDIAAIVRVARDHAPVILSGAARARLEAARAVVDRYAQGDLPIYGLTTALGAGVDTRLSAAELADFQQRAIQARSVGVGQPLPSPAVRAMMLARLSGLAAGRSGISPRVVDALITLLNARIHPVVPSIGSIGAADLAPLAHMGLVLLGLGQAEHDGTVLDGTTALARAGLKPIQLAPKDGIALLNANAASVGPGALVLADAGRLLDALAAAASLSFEGFRANLSPLDPRLRDLRPAPGQLAVTAQLSALLAGSALWQPGAARRVQDPLSFRCVTPVHGAAIAALEAARACVEVELNGAGDNPAVLAEHDAILSTANFDMTALALGFESLGQALAQTASLSLGRIMKLMSPAYSDLPRFLSPRGPTRTGFATTQKTAAALEAEIRHLAVPVSLHVAAVADGVEDYATMAPRVVAKTGEIVFRLRLLASLELIVAAQSIDLRKPDSIGVGPRAAYDTVRAAVAMLEEDRPTGPDIEAVAALIEDGTLARAIAGVVS